MRLSQVIVLGGIFILAAAAVNAQNSGPSAPLNFSAPASCSKSLISDFELTRRDGDPAGDIPIWQIAGSSAFFYEAGMSIDADGAPNAYNPDNTGLDDLENAGDGAEWWALAVDEHGQPILQGPNDPFPGFYISMTALADRTKDRTDPSRFVDASKIPYIVLPGQVMRQTGARLGDFAVVFNQRNAKFSYAIFADIGPAVGEGSVALAENLGISSSARRGGTRGDILYLVFPGSGNGNTRPVEEIDQEAAKLLGDSKVDQIKACPTN